MANSLQQKVRAVLDTKKLAMNVWSKDAGLGTTYVRDLLRASNPKPSAENLRSLAKAAGLPLNHFIEPEDESIQSGAKASVALKEESSVSHLRANIPSKREELNLPFYVTSPSKKVGEWLMAKESHENRFRPGGLSGRSDVWCCYVQTPEMGDRYQVGDMIYVEKNRPAASGEDMLIELRGDADGDRRIILRRLVAREGDHLKVRQIDPPKSFNVKLDDIEATYRVLRGQDLS